MSSLPLETKFHKTKAKPIMAIILVGVPLMLSGYSFINTLMFGKDNVLIYLVVSFSVFAVCVFFEFKKVLFILANEPLITLNHKGILIGQSKFVSWNEIMSVRVDSQGERTHLLSYLIFDYKGGNEKLLINELTASPDEVYKTILRYRADSNFSPAISSKKVDEKEEMMKKFFEN